MKDKIQGIYCIEAISGNPNKVGWKYIGKSQDCLIRKKHHFNQLKLNKHLTDKLQNYFNKYGKMSFRFYIIKECLISELNFYEKFFIQCFDSFKNGFNQSLGGDSLIAITKPCIFQNIDDGRIEKFDSIAEFARKYDFSGGRASNVINGKSNYIGNWFCPENKWRPKFHKIISPTGKEYKFFNASEFCDKHKIHSKGSFNSMLHGRLYSYKGWKSLETGRKNQCYIPFKLIGPNNKIIKGTNLTKFAKENNLHTPNLHRVISGERNSCSGWRLYRKEICG